MGMKYNPSEFDPDKLGKVISSEPMYEDINYNRPSDSDEGPQIIGYKVVRESPWGPILVNAKDAQGTPKSAEESSGIQYSTARPNADGTIGDFNNQVGFVKTGDGKFVEFDGAQYQTEMSRGGQYGQFFKFLAAAGLGAGAAYASGVNGANAAFTAGAGEGGVSSIGGVTTGGAGTGSSIAANQANPGYGEAGGLSEPAAASNPGYGEVGGLTEPAAAANPGYAEAGGLTEPAATNTATQQVAQQVANNTGVETASSYWDKLFGFAKTTGGGQIVAGIVSGIGQGLLAGSKDGAGDAKEIAQMKIDADAAENDKQRAHASRNFQPGMVPKIDWGPMPTMAASPKMKNSYNSDRTEPATAPDAYVKSKNLTTYDPEEAERRRKPIIAGARYGR